MKQSEQATNWLAVDKNNPPKPFSSGISPFEKISVTTRPLTDKSSYD